MPEETDPESSDANVEGEARGRPRPRVGAAFAGETTGSFSESPEPAPTKDSSAGVGPDDATIVSPAGGASHQVIGDYEILGKLGQGGMGAVYRARQISLNRQVALKVLPTNLEADSEFVARFQREARMAASLNHRNIVKVYASGLVDGCHFIAMELIEGETLAQFVRRGALEPTDALRITRDVALALQCGWNTAHLIHRDIKPGNIFLSQDGEVKVGDLGLAKSLANDTTGLTQTGTAMGTPHYISPEQSRGDKDIDFRADIYSLGCTLYQMLTGRTPYSGSDAVAVMSMHRDAPPPAILKVLPQTPIPVARLVGKMLKKIKRERQGSYEELIAEIEKVQALYAPSEEASLASMLPVDPDATMLEAPTPTPASAPNSARSRVPTAATMALPKAKSKLPLYGGIAAALVVAGVVFVVLRPKAPEKLTKAEMAMRDREAAEKAKPAVATPARGGLPAAIRLTDTAENIAFQPGVSWEKGVLYLDKHSQNFSEVRGRDGILRASVRTDEKGCELALRFTKGLQPGKFVSYILSVGPQGQPLKFRCQGAGQDGILQSWKWPRAYGPQDWIPLEVRAVGDEFTISLDGAVLGTVRDSQHPGVGILSLYSPGKSDFRDVEYIPLDGEAPAMTAGNASSAWKPLFTKPEWESPGDRREFKDGLVHLTNYGVWTRPMRSPNGALRARIQFQEGSGASLAARSIPGRGNYKLAVSEGSTLQLNFSSPSDQGGRPETIGTYTLSTRLQPGESYTLEFRLEGNKLTGLYNDVAAIEVVDDHLTAAGDWGIYAKDGWYESVEFMPLVVNALSRGEASTEIVPAGAPGLVRAYDIRLNGDAVLVDDDTRALLLDGAGKVQLLDLATGKAVWSLSAQFGDLVLRGSVAGTAFRIGRDKGHVAVARIDLATGASLSQWDAAGSAGVTSEAAALSPDGRHLALASYSRPPGMPTQLNVWVLSPETLKVEAEWTVPEPINLYNTAWLNADEFAVSTGHEKAFLVFRPFPIAQPPRPHPAKIIYQFAVDPEKGLLAGNRGPNAMLLNLADGRPSQMLRDDAPLRRVRFFGESSLATIDMLGKNLTVWDVRTGRSVSEFSTAPRRLDSLSLSRNGIFALVHDLTPASDGNKEVSKLTLWRLGAK